MSIRHFLAGAACIAALVHSSAPGAVEFAVSNADLPFPAASVSVAGSFNEWSPERLVLGQTESGFLGSAELPDGNHAYKIVVKDPQGGLHWMTDRANPAYQSDGYGGVNNFLAVKEGKRVPAPEGLEKFEWKGEATASVCVAGEFNAWNSENAALRRGDDGVWRGFAKVERPFVYKFVIDGQTWTTEPAAGDVQVVTDLQGMTNNLRANVQITSSVPEGWEAAPAEATPTPQ